MTNITGKVMKLSWKRSKVDTSYIFATCLLKGFAVRFSLSEQSSEDEDLDDKNKRQIATLDTVH